MIKTKNDNKIVVNGLTCNQMQTIGALIMKANCVQLENLKRACKIEQEQKTTQEENKEIIHWGCSCCHKQITKYHKEEDIIEADLHYDISISQKDLNLFDNEIKENLKYRNEKMSRHICEECFIKILNESETLEKIFFYKEKHAQNMECIQK